MTTFVDTCVLLALLNKNESHHTWSIEKFNSRRLIGPLIIPDIVYCEFSVGMLTKEQVDATVEQFALERIAIDDIALFRAGKAFKEYKSRRGANKTNVLPDFLIGAIAEVTEVPLMTTNAKDFTGYFPRIKLISP